MAASPQARWATALAGLAVWASSVPWLAEAVGLKLDVVTRLEVVDHVVPGVVMLAGAAVLATRAGAPGGRVWLGAGGIAFLTGLWITATHVPLIPDALDGHRSLGHRAAAPQHRAAHPRPRGVDAAARQ